MKKSGGAVARLAAIGRRQRKRRLRALRDQRRLERESTTTRDAHLRLLAELCGKLECGHFTADEIADARASLQQPRQARQQLLDLRGANR